MWDLGVVKPCLYSSLDSGWPIKALTPAQRGRSIVTRSNSSDVLPAPF